MKSFKNSRKVNFLSTFSEASLDDEADQLTKRCKFNFYYMDFSQPVGQNFSDWNQEQLVKLLNKLKNYGEQPLKYWLTQAQRVGKRSHNVLEIYGRFPLKSAFKHPKHVPHQVQWARFRIENLVRLVGFVVPSNYEGQPHLKTKMQFDCNTFYAVFLDKDHQFYIS